jgi:hypothetical protein
VTQRRHGPPRAVPPCCEFQATARNGMGDAERFVGGQIRRLTAQGCLDDRNSWIQEHGEVSHGAQLVRRRERAAGALRRVAARRPSNNVPHGTRSEPSQIGR